MKIKIKVTKDILKRSAMCGTFSQIAKVIENCAIALAVREVFPNAVVGQTSIRPFGYNITPSIELPRCAKHFIKLFDKSCPIQRVSMPEFEFTVDVPDSVIDKIGIKDAIDIINKSETLELV